MIGMIDYGAGNMRSLANALRRLQLPFRVCEAAEDLNTVDKVILPGVGQFAAAMRRLRETGMSEALISWGREGKPIVGICLGLQLLFESSDEAPGVPGLGLLPGRVFRLEAKVVPHMGWNRVSVLRETPWLNGANGAHFYFAHGFAAACDNVVLSATATLEQCDVPAAIERGSLRAVQFHPEKSEAAGARLLERMLSC